MRLSRRGLILGGSALLAGCSSAASTTTSLQLAGAVAPTLPTLPERAAAAHVQVAEAGTTIDPHGVVRKDLLERARAAMDVHGHKISRRDRMYLVDFQKFSGEDRFYEVDLEGGWVTAYAHMASTAVKIKDRIAQGQTIGTVGRTGGVEAPQLHFELRYAPSPREKARPIDPALVMPR